MTASQAIALAALSVGALLSGACDSPANAMRPVIYANNDQAAAAVRSAPVILVVRVARVKGTGEVRIVEKPSEVGGPSTPTVPLRLARISADVLLAVRGQARETVEFYSWVWDSGSHGGPRLFRPSPGSTLVLFLRREAGYLRTVGDYLAYDLELSPRWTPALLALWNSGQRKSGDPLERLVDLRLRAELESLSKSQLQSDFGEDGPRVNHHWVRDLSDLIRVAGPFFLATQLDEICLHSENPSARFAACFVTAQYFPGRCNAFHRARESASDGFGGDYLTRLSNSCQAQDRELIEDLCSGFDQRGSFYGTRMSPQHRRETLRVYATAMDPTIRRVTCEVAAKTPEARDIEECAEP